MAYKGYKAYLGGEYQGVLFINLSKQLPVVLVRPVILEYFKMQDYFVVEKEIESLPCAIIEDLESTLLSLLGFWSKYTLMGFMECTPLKYSIARQTDTYMEFFNEYNQKVYTYNYAEHYTLDKVKEIILVDEEVKQYVDVELFAEYVYKYADRNALSICENICLVWDGITEDEQEEHISAVRKQLADDYGDDYAYEVGAGLLGVMWNERNTVLLIVSQMVESLYSEVCSNIRQGVRECLYITLHHEFRHLVYDCAEVLTGEDTVYDEQGGKEKNVEQYAVDRYWEIENILNS